MKQTLAVDFDGVIHDRPKSERGCMKVTGEAVPGAMHFLATMIVPFDVVIFSARFENGETFEVVREWVTVEMIKYVELRKARGKNVATAETIMDKISLSATKPIAHVYLDDRAICFRGEWPTVNEIMHFKTWTESEL